MYVALAVVPIVWSYICLCFSSINLIARTRAHVLLISPLCRLCVILLVQDTSSYNDTTTSLFREVAKSGAYSRHSPRLQFSFSYLDTTKQSKFLENFDLPAVSLKSCPDGTQARPVCLTMSFVQLLFVF